MKEKYEMRYEMHAHNVRAISNHPLHDFKKVEQEESPDIIVNIGEFSYKKDTLSKLDYWFYGREGEDFVYYDDRALGIKDKVLLSYLKKEKVEIYAMAITPKIDRIYVPWSRGSLEELIKTIIRIKQIEKGYLPIHASCLSKNGEAILFAAFPNVGKTLVALQLLKTDFRYLSDDTVLVDNSGTAHLTSFPSAVGYYDFLRFIRPEDIGIRKYYTSFIKSWFMHKSKFLNRILNSPHLTLGNLYKTVDRARVGIVCTLEIGPRAIKEVEQEDIFKKIRAINEYSLPSFHDNPFIKVYDYFNPGYIESIREKENENLLRFISNCRCYSLACNNWDWVSLVREIRDVRVI